MSETTTPAPLVVRRDADAVVVDGDLAPHPFSDGRIFDPEVVKREVLFHAEGHLWHAFEIGKRLVWAKEALSHGQWQAWCADLPFGLRSGQRYMQLAHRLQKHPTLVKPLQKLGLKKALLIAAMDDAELQQLNEEGLVAGVPLEELGGVSSVDLRKMLAGEQKERQQAEVHVAELTDRLAKAEDEVKAHKEALATRRGAMALDVEREFDAALDQVRKSFENMMLASSMTLDGIGYRKDEVSPRVRSKATALFEFMAAYVENERLMYQSACGDHVPSALFYELREQCPDLPDNRMPPEWDQ